MLSTDVHATLLLWPLISSLKSMAVAPTILFNGISRPSSFIAFGSTFRSDRASGANLNHKKR
jgi:hypothetical protein